MKRQQQQQQQFDEILARIGEFGRYQRRHYLLVCLPAVLCSLHKLVWVFIAYVPGHRCELPGVENSTWRIQNDSLLRQLIPWDDTNSRLDRCTYYSSHSGNSGAGAAGPAGGADSNVTDIPMAAVQSCPRGPWVWDTDHRDVTLIIEWDIACDRKWMKSTSASIFFGGVLLGSLVFGQLSDKIGRKKTFLGSIALITVSGIGAGLVPDYYSFTALRVLVGSATSGIFLVGYVLALELVGPSKRLIVGMCIQFFFTAGYLLTGAFAYVIRTWRHVQIAISVPGLVFIAYVWILPESARWLLANGRRREAAAIIRTAAAVNGVTLLPADKYLEEALSAPTGGGLEMRERLRGRDQEANGEQDEKLNSDAPTLPQAEEPAVEATAAPGRQPSAIDLFRWPNLRKKSLNIFFCWFVNSMVYYGLSLGSGSLSTGSDRFLNFTISGVVEVPAYIICILILNRAGRRAPLAGFMIIGGLACVSTYFVPKDLVPVTVALAMLGKFCITASYGIIYIFSAEHFPTVVRNVGMGMSSLCARIGGISAPQIGQLEDIHAAIPLIVFGVLTVLSGTLALLLPETNGRPLPDTIEDGERLGLKHYNHPADTQPVT